jgi:hypothetical protein
MTKTLKRAGAFCRRHATQVAVAGAGVIGAGVAFPAVSGATTTAPTTVSSGASVLSSGLLTDLGIVIGLIVGIAVVALGVRMLLKGSKRAVSEV